MRRGRIVQQGWRCLAALLIAGALPLGMTQPAQAAPADLVNTGTWTYDHWQLLPGNFFAYAFEATGSATATSATVLFGAATVEADLVGSKISICTGYPAAPSDPNSCFGSMAYVSMAADARYPTLKRATFTGSVVIAPGTHWFKVHGVPVGRSAWIRHGDVSNSGTWNVPSAAGVTNWAAITQYSPNPQTQAYGNYTGKFTLSGEVGNSNSNSSSNSNGSGSADATQEEPANPPVMQQYARAMGEACPAGWGESWAQWPHEQSGGFVCSRTVRWDYALAEWIPV